MRGAPPHTTDNHPATKRTGHFVWADSESALQDIPREKRRWDRGALVATSGRRAGGNAIVLVHRRAAPGRTCHTSTGGRGRGAAERLGMSPRMSRPGLLAGREIEEQREMYLHIKI